MISIYYTILVPVVRCKGSQPFQRTIKVNVRPTTGVLNVKEFLAHFFYEMFMCQFDERSNYLFFCNREDAPSN